MSMNLALLFLAAAGAYHLPSGLLQAVCYVESGHDIQAINHHDGGSKSLGICQIKYDTARQMGFRGTPQELMVPGINIKYGAKYLADRISRCGSVDRGIMAYNTGSCSRSSIGYLRKVHSSWKNQK